MMLGAQRGRSYIKRLKGEGGERQSGREKKNEKVLNMEVLSNK